MMSPRPTTDSHNTAAAPTPPASIFQRPSRSLAHAALAALAMQAIDAAIQHHQLPAILLPYARPGMFIPWSVGLAGALNDDRLTLTILAVVIVLMNWPDHLLPPAIAAMFGMILGSAIRTLIIKEKASG